jgi:hypothetical protein
MSKQTDLSRRVTALSTSVQNLTQRMIDFNDRLFSHEAAEGEVLAKAVSMTPGGDAARLQSRVEHLEEIARLVTKPGGVADGERLLAKAAAAFDTPDSLMALAERTIHDPTAMGEFSAHLSTGNVAEARRMLTHATDRASFAKSVDAADDLLNAPLDDFANKRGLSELTARFAQLERTLASITTRLDQLERPQPAAPVPGEQVIVKAASVTGKKRRRTPGEESAQLLAMLDAYVDSPNTAGAISSLIQAGKFSEARPILERAKQAHETEKVRQERKSWTQ